jgi:hypothetical protein
LLLLRFVHAPVDQEIRRALGDRRPNTQTGTIPLGVVDQPSALAAEILIDFVPCVPQLGRRYALRAVAVLTLIDLRDILLCPAVDQPLAGFD